MRQRQEQIGDLAGPLQHVQRDAHVDHGPIVAVREHATLRGAGGPRRVDERERVLGGDLRAAGLELGCVSPSPALAQLAQWDGVGHLALGVDDHHQLELGQALPDGEDLGHLAGVLAHDRPGLRVARHPLAFLRRVGRIDRDRHRARAGDGELDVRPLGAGVAQDADPVAELDARVDQSQPDLPHDLAHLGEGHVLPLALALVLDSHPVGEALGSQGHQVGDGPGSGGLPGRGGAGGGCGDLHLSSSGGLTGRRF